MEDSNLLQNWEKISYETTDKGFDFVEFFISTNVGEEPRPLAKVASGGEISRIMLALKNNLGKERQAAASCV